MFFFANSSLLTVNKKDCMHTNTKNVEPVLSLVPRFEGLRIALSVETSNAESPTYVYIYRTNHLFLGTILPRRNGRNGYNTPMRRPRCFVFDRQMKLRSSRIVKTKAQDTPLLLCMCPARLSATWAFSKAMTLQN